MSSKAKYQKSTSKTKEVTCRVETCKDRIALQNYPRHLQRNHPEEDSTDLRVYRDQSIMNWATRGSGAAPRHTVTRGLLHGSDVSGAARVEQGLQGTMDEEGAELEELVGGGDHLERESDDDSEQESDDDETTDDPLKIEEALVKNIEEMAKKVGEIDISDCNSAAEAANKRVEAVKNFLDVGKEIKQLNSAVQNLKDSCGVKETKNEDVNINTESVLKEARSMKQITDKIAEFDYEEFKDGGKVTCVVCNSSFKYSRNLILDFSAERKMSREFINLKLHLKDHLKTLKHQNKLKEAQKKEMIQTKEDSRSMAVGLRNGRLVYYQVKMGRPDTDYPLLVQMSVANGSDMGDINHSKAFVTKFIPSLAAAVRRRWTEMLGTPMVATGCR